MPRPEQPYLCPATIAEALQYAEELREEFVFVAGATDIQVHRKHGLVQSSHAIDLSGIPELHHINLTEDALDIGAMVTLDELVHSQEAASWCTLIREAAGAIATPVIRMSATVGGNLLVSNRCTYYNQSRFWRQAAGSCLRDTGDTCLATNGGDTCFSRNVSDLAPALIALNAQATLRDPASTRTLPLIDLYAPDGIQYHANMSRHTILEALHLPLKPVRYFFHKLRRRESIDFTSLTVAGTIDESNTARICINGVSMSPVLLESDLDAAALSELQKRARKECKTVNNDILPLKYRRDMMDTLIADCRQALAVK